MLHFILSFALTAAATQPPGPPPAEPPIPGDDVVAPPATPRARPEAPREPLLARLEEDLTERFPDDLPGAAIAVVRHGEPLILTRGMADRGTGIPVGPDTPFYVASLGKTFTAAAVLTLAEEGRLDLDASIRRYVPHLPDAYERVTLRLLLGHQGGVADFFRVLDDKVPDGLTNGDVIRLLAKHGALDFVPGTDIAYSNSGYVLLAEAVRRVSGMGFAVWMERRIFRPLGMDAFVVEPGTTIPENVARGYVVTGEGTVSPSGYTLRTVGPGSIYASIRDLVRWDRELRDGRVLSDAVREQMCTAVAFEGGHSPFSPGWIAGDIVQGPLQGKKVQQAFGDLAGFRSGMRRFLQDGLTVIWLTNGGRHLFDLDLAERFLLDGD